MFHSKPPPRAEDGQEAPPLSPTPMHSYRDISMADGWIELTVAICKGFRRYIILN